EPTELPLLTIPHPGQSNHNGGMLAFGPDGMLYIGTGDGGGSNDPQNNAQNIEVLLGKILRLDVDQPDLVGGTRYSSPADNPYVGRAGRDEIHSTGWRNPWRFSFDRLTGQGWVADVGQGEREEIDSPLLLGGNYGWRVYEGTRCTGLDSALCIPANFVAPLLEYTHVSGRCSVTGGYVYRGSRNALPAGTYVFADFCTGEVFGWNGVTQSLLLASG
ncbi:MAG: PQQ-dependent sugar dehydrogenase, partial [Candidatus Hydrogenedentes bacterium]|nr:PQQ-dependent sugar dehydrogenase [Candidatus Hydrogenedentota bacterium]